MPPYKVLQQIKSAISSALEQRPRLRDSSAQVSPYLPLLGRDRDVQRLIAGLIRR